MGTAVPSLSTSSTKLGRDCARSHHTVRPDRRGTRRNSLSTRGRKSRARGGRGRYQEVGGSGGGRGAGGVRRGGGGGG
eukprot:1932362-Rhodomonas_salina.1